MLAPMQAPGGRAGPGRIASSPPSSGPSLAFNKPSHSARHSASKPQPAKPGQDPSHSVRAVAAEFPPALRLYVLILEATDSYRLNANLDRYIRIHSYTSIVVTATLKPATC